MGPHLGPRSGSGLDQDILANLSVFVSDLL